MTLWAPFAEFFYGRFIFPLTRWIYDYTIGLLPFPFVYVVILLLAIGMWRLLKKSSSILEASKAAAMYILLFVALFFWSWGYNYQRPTVKEKLALTIPLVKMEHVERMFCRLTDSLPVWRADLVVSPVDSLESLVRLEAKKFLQDQSIVAPGRPRIRGLKPNGVLLGISTAGIYIPYSFEAHYDNGLHQLALPYIMSHEVSHAFGITDEGECNFLGALICRNSTDPYFKYSGGIYELQRLYGAMVSYGFNADQLRSDIDQLVLADIKEIRLKHDQYPTYFPEKLRNLLYDTYLKSQGVKSGLASYGEVLGLLMAWELRYSPQ
jgi:hypothetical protein